MDDLTIVGIANIFTGLLMVGFAIPLIRRKVKKSRIYGVRFKQSYASEDHWYAINAYGGRLLLWNGLLILASGIAAFFVPATDTATIILALVPMTVLLTCLASYRFSKRYKPQG